MTISLSFVNERYQSKSWSDVDRLQVRCLVLFNSITFLAHNNFVYVSHISTELYTAVTQSIQFSYSVPETTIENYLYGGPLHISQGS